MSKQIAKKGEHKTWKIKLKKKTWGEMGKKKEKGKGSYSGSKMVKFDLLGKSWVERESMVSLN